MYTVTVNISFRKDLLERIDAAAENESRTRSELIREAARMYIENKDNERLSIDKSPKRKKNIVYQPDDDAGGMVAETAARYDTSNGRRYSYADYLTWPEDERWEIIDGVPYDMNAGPNIRHQEISTALTGEFYIYLKNRPCKVFSAPLDVRFAKDLHAKPNEIFNIVQPDLMVLCKKERMDEKGIIMAPDLVVEILSPSTSRKDCTKKFDLYEREGVREYWIIRPSEETVQVFTLCSGNRYGRPDMYTLEDKLKVGIFPDFVIDLKDIFGYTIE